MEKGIALREYCFDRAMSLTDGQKLPIDGVIEVARKLEDYLNEERELRREGHRIWFTSAVGVFYKELD